MNLIEEVIQNTLQKYLESDEKSLNFLKHLRGTKVVYENDELLVLEVLGLYANMQNTLSYGTNWISLGNPTRNGIAYPFDRGDLCFIDKNELYKGKRFHYSPQDQEFYGPDEKVITFEDLCQYFPNSQDYFQNFIESKKDKALNASKNFEDAFPDWVLDYNNNFMDDKTYQQILENYLKLNQNKYFEDLSKIPTNFLTKDFMIEFMKTVHVNKNLDICEYGKYIPADIRQDEEFLNLLRKRIEKEWEDSGLPKEQVKTLVDIVIDKFK